MSDQTRLIISYRLEGSGQVGSFGFEIADFDSCSAQYIHDTIITRIQDDFQSLERHKIVITQLINLGKRQAPRPIAFGERYISPDRCMVCGDPIGHGGLQCPKMAVYS